MAVVDANAMYRAGLARGSEGRNPKVEERLKRQERLVDFAYGVVGTVATEAIRDGFEGLQKFRDIKESQTAAMQLAVDKLPRENVQLNNDVRLIYSNFRDAARRSRTTFGKKRAQAKADMHRYMTQMKDFNAFLEANKVGVTEKQGSLNVASGIAGADNQAGNVNLSPALLHNQFKNAIELGTGRASMLLNWDHEEGTMRMQRGGKWIQDENGKDSYVNLGIEENEELLKKYKAYEKDFEQKTKTEGDEVDFTLTGQDFLDQNITRQQDVPTKLSYQEWAKNQDIKTLRNPRYNDVKFGRKENKQMVGEWLEAKTLFYNRGYKKNAAPWSDIAQDEKDLFSVKIDRYSDHTFQDFFFGGIGFNHATRRISEDSLAYKLLMSRNTNHDFSSGIGVDDGDNTNNLIPPGSPGSTRESNIKWEGALETLKAQSMVPGSIYRQYAKQTLWGELQDRYTKGQASWRTQNPAAIDKNAPKYINLFGKQLEAPKPNTTAAAQLATVQNIVGDAPTVIVGNTKYKRMSIAGGYDYRAVEDKAKYGVWSPIPKSDRVDTRKEDLIRSASPIYGGHISENYFGEDEWRKGKASTYKPPTTTPPLTIEQMKTALKNSGGPYDLNAPDEQIRKMYKKYFQSLLKSTKKKTTTFTPDFPSGGIK